jgi:mRNA interferase MazF
VKRGDVVVVATKGPYSGKPRPAVVVQSDLFNPTHASITVCLLTTDLKDAPLFRPTVEPSADNGLRRRSQIMVDKVFSAPREKVGAPIGTLDGSTLDLVDEALRIWLQV